MAALILGLKLGMSIGGIKGCFHSMRNYKPVKRDMKGYAIAATAGLGIEGSTTYLTTKVFSDTSVITSLLSYPYISTFAGTLMTLGVGYYSGIISMNFFKVPSNDNNNDDYNYLKKKFLNIADVEVTTKQNKRITHDKTKDNRKE